MDPEARRRAAEILGRPSLLSAYCLATGEPPAELRVRLMKVSPLPWDRERSLSEQITLVWVKGVASWLADVLVSVLLSSL